MSPSPATATPSDAQAEARRSLMALCAAASADELETAIAAIKPRPRWQDVRPVEQGLVMVRGRIGGDGAPFNLGEASVTRAAVQLADGPTGFSYVLGRSEEKARLAAVIDALGQVETYRKLLQAAFVEPVSRRVAAERARREAETAATKVEFFTMVRGDD